MKDSVGKRNVRWNRDQDVEVREMNDFFSHVRAVLVTTIERWQSLATNVPENMLERFAAPGEWSAVQCVRHLRDAERDVFLTRLQAFLAGQDLVPYDPERNGRPAASETPRQLVEEFSRLRAETLALLADLTDLDLDRTVNHGDYGPVRLCEMLHQWAAHDLMHTVQAERALMQPLVAGSGPWRETFRDHDLSMSN